MFELLALKIKMSSEDEDIPEIELDLVCKPVSIYEGNLLLPDHNKTMVSSRFKNCGTNTLLSFVGSQVALRDSLLKAKKSKR